jgi:hypothetical protein
MLYFERIYRNANKATLVYLDISRVKSCKKAGFYREIVYSRRRDALGRVRFNYRPSGDVIQTPCSAQHASCLRQKLYRLCRTRHARHIKRYLE